MVTVCQTCGDEGFSVALIYCNNCEKYAVHRYCLKVMPATFEEDVVWLCVDCELKVAGSSTLQQDLPATELQSRLENEHYSDIPMLQVPDNIERLLTMDGPSCDNKDSTLEAKTQLSSHGPGLREADDEVESVNNQTSLAAVNNDRSNMTDHAFPELSFRELDGAYTDDMARCVKNNTSLMASSYHMPTCGYLPAQPVVVPVWRGRFNICNENHGIGIVAHLSSLACLKVCEAARCLSESLCLELLPRCDVWPKGFKERGPSEESIALYFFPEDGSQVKVFDSLVDKMIGQDCALRTVVQDAELLVFSSQKLPNLLWRFQEKLYLWGVFRAKQGLTNGEAKTNMRASTLHPRSSVSPISGSAILEEKNFKKDLTLKLGGIRVGIEAMRSSFDQQNLVEKLARLTNSQASITTLSHWCIFHMNMAKQVVGTWDRQFYCSPRDQRLAFLHLANEILRNSKHEGSEYVDEFWKVLPDALGDVIKNGDEFGRNATLRLIGIWEEKKMFGCRGQILKEELVGKQSENNNNRRMRFQLKQPVVSRVDKIVSGYQVIYGGPMDEDVIVNKCRNAIACIEKVDKGISSDVNSLHGQYAVLGDCIEQLTTVASSRANLIAELREALEEQELKLEQVHIQLRAAQSQSKRASDICRQFMNRDNPQLVAKQSLKEPHPSVARPSFIPAATEHSARIHIEEDPRISAAAAAANLTASSPSAHISSFDLLSGTSKGVIGNQSSGDYPSEKRPELGSDQPCMPSQNPQQAQVSPFLHTGSHQHKVTQRNFHLVHHHSRHHGRQCSNT